MHIFHFQNINYFERRRKAKAYMRNCNAQNPMAPSCPMEQRFDIDSDFVVAMAYVPWQKFGPLYDAEKGLMIGTIFPELDKPFLGRRAFRR